MPYSNTTPTYRIPYNSQGEISSGISNKRSAYIIDSQIQGASRLIGTNGILQEGIYTPEFATANAQNASVRVTLPAHDIAGQSGTSLIFTSSTSGLLSFIADNTSGISQSYAFGNHSSHSYGVVIGTADSPVSPHLAASKIAQLLDPDTGEVQGFQTLVSGTSAFVIIQTEDLIPMETITVGTPSDWLGEILVPGMITGPGRVTLTPSATNFAMEAMIDGVYVATNDILVWDNIPANSKAWLYAQTKEQNIYQSNEFSSLAKKQVATTWNNTGITPDNAILIGIVNTSLSGISLNIDRSGVSDSTFPNRPVIFPYNTLVGQFLSLASEFSGLEAASFRGLSGYSGPSGYSGKSGYSGRSGYSGYSGYSGFGKSGFSGYSGYSGYSSSGYSGYSGTGLSDAIDGGIKAVTIGLDYVDISYNIIFSGLPATVATLEHTSLAPDIRTLKAITSGTTVGFTAVIDSPVEAANAYNVHWHAIYFPPKTISVLICRSDCNSSTNAMGDALTALGFNVTTLSNLGTTTPSLSTLQQYDVVLVYSFCAFADEVTLGDNLADYIDGGGVVIASGYTWWTGLSHYAIGGRWSSDGYSPFNTTTSDPFDNVTMSTCTFSSFCNGVTTLGTHDRLVATVASGATSFGTWSDSSDLGAYKGNAVAINSYFGDHDPGFSGTGDFAILIQNIINYYLG